MGIFKDERAVGLHLHIETGGLEAVVLQPHHVLGGFREETNCVAPSRVKLKVCN